MKACKSFEQQVECHGCPEELRPELVRQVTEEEKVGMVCLTKKVFDALPPLIKEPYLACMQQIGLSSSPEFYNLLATHEHLQTLRDTKTLYVINFHDARTGVILSTTGYPLGPLIFGPQGCAREGLELIMKFRWEGEGLIVSWVHVGVVKIGEGGGPVVCVQCLPMVMGWDLVV